MVVLDEPDLLRQALAGVGAVINCAGPFLDTALPLAKAAVEAGAHYLDVTAEQPAVTEIYRALDGPARDAGVAIVPAMAFYGGLADLQVTAALDGDSRADEVEVAIGLDRWWPTDGTRATGARNTAIRQVIRDGILAPLANPAPTSTWSYPEPLGDQPVVQMPFSEVITIDRHLDVGELRSYLNTTPLADLRDSATPPPTTVDLAPWHRERPSMPPTCLPRWSETSTISWCGEIGPDLACPRPSVQPARSPRKPGLGVSRRLGQRLKVGSRRGLVPTPVRARRPAG